MNDLQIAMQALNTDDNDKARRYLEKALESDQENAVLHHKLGVVLARLSEDEAAEKCFRKAIDKDETLFIAYRALTKFLMARGRYEEAGEVCRAALKVNPEAPYILMYLGLINKELGRLDQAEARINEALEVSPAFDKAWSNLGIVLEAKGEPEQAIKAYEKAVQLNPAFAEAYNNLGFALFKLGKKEEARQVFESWLQAEPCNGNAHHMLARSKRYKSEDDPHLNMMLELKRQDALNEETEPLVHFAIAKAMEDLENYEEAWDALQKANELTRKHFSDDISSARQYFENIKDGWRRRLSDMSVSIESPPFTPVFIVGTPRSGTTLIEQIIGSHPDVTPAGEMDFLERAAYEEGLYSKTAEEWLDKADRKDLKSIAQNYYESVHESVSIESRYVTDKMPENFRFVGLIKSLFPNAKVIHACRDPRDACLSIYKQYFVGGFPYVYDRDEMVEYYGLYKDLMAFWHENLPGFIRDVQYEALVENPEPLVRGLLEFCDLEWNDACLNFHQSRRPVETASALQVRRPLYSSSVGRWKNFEPYAGSFFKRLEEWLPGPDSNQRPIG